MSHLKILSRSDSEVVLTIQSSEDIALYCLFAKIHMNYNSTKHAAALVIIGTGIIIRHSQCFKLFVDIFLAVIFNISTLTWVPD